MTPKTHLGRAIAGLREAAQLHNRFIESKDIASMALVGSTAIRLAEVALYHLTCVDVPDTERWMETECCGSCGTTDVVVDFGDHVFCARCAERSAYLTNEGSC